MQGKLLALSFDTIASPTIGVRRDEQSGAPASSWGFAWYPSDESGSAVIKDPYDRRQTSLRDVLPDWDRFRSTSFLCYFRPEAKRSTQQDTPPFVRNFANAEFLFTHSGDLEADFAERLLLNPRAAFEPVGATDSEHAFCWLLGQLHAYGARRLADVDFSTLYQWLQTIDQCGFATMMLTDGVDVVAYRDSGGDGTLHWVRRRPPHAVTEFEAAGVTMHLDDPYDTHRTFVLISTDPLSDDGWTPLGPGQMVIVRRGAVRWSSDATVPTSVTAPPHATPPAPAPELTPQILTSKRAAPFVPSPEAGMLATPQQGFEALSGMMPATGDRLVSRVLRVEHETRYAYGQPVERSAHIVRLHPVLDLNQEVQQFALDVQPHGDHVAFDDVFGNRVLHLTLDEPYSEFVVTMTAQVRIVWRPIQMLATRPVRIPLVWMPWQRQMMHAYLLPPELPETQLHELSDFAMSFVERQGYDLLEALTDLNATIYRDFDYVSGSTTLETTPFEVFTNRRGVCQDFANLFICLARLLGVPARYRVGYIYTGADYENKIQSEASHAWAEVYLPNIGWRGFDPTNGIPAGLDHIRVAAGRNYRDATPTSGTIFKGGVGETLTVNVRVEEIEAAPLPEGSA